MTDPAAVTLTAAPAGPAAVGSDRLDAEGDASCLVEREHERSRLAAALTGAAAGSGGVVLVEGPAGIGKSVLLRHTADEATRRGFRVLRALGTELERDYTYGGVHQLLERLLRTASHRHRERWLAGAAAVVGGLIRPAGAGKARPAETGPAAEFRLLHGLYWTLVNLSDDRPVLVVLDDFQWLDEATRRLATFLAHRVAATPVLLVIGNRTGGAGGADVPPDLRRATTLTPLTPTPLGEQGIATLAGRILGGEADPAFAAACLQATGGVPFYADALLRQLARDGCPPARSAVPTVAALAPTVVTRTVAGQLESEGPDATAVARAVAALGTPDSLAVLADVAGTGVDRARQEVGRLAELGLVAADGLSLAHPIIATAVLSDLTLAERSDLHRRAASRLRTEPVPPERVAAHLLRTTAEHESWVVDLLRDAAAAAHGRGGAADAVTFLTRALQEVVAPAQRRTVRWELGDALATVDPEAAIEHLTAAVEHGREATWWPEAVRRLAGTLAYVNRPDEALAVVERGIAEIPVSDPRAARLLVDWYFFAIVADRTPLALGRTEEIQDRLERHDPTAGRLFLGATLLGLVESNAPAAEIADAARRAWSTGDLLDVEPPDSHLHWSPLYSLVVSGELAAAESGIDRLLAASRARGSRAGLGMAFQLRALLRLYRGELAEAEADAEEAIEHTAAAIPFCLPMSVALLVEVLLERGNGEQARALVDRWSEQVLTATGGPVDGFRIATGLLALTAGRFEAAADHLLEAGRRRTRFAAGPTVMPWRPAAARALHAIGATDRARAIADEQLRHAERFGAAYPLAIAMHAAAQVGRPEDRDRRLREVVDLLAPTPYRLEHARALVGLGAALKDRGREDEAVAALGDGMDRAAACGARPLAEQAADELRACGARPRRLALTGVHALTPSELRVAQLAATGEVTNRDIAQQLFVTVKTVEVHLTSTYRKLGVASRRDLPAALERAVD